MLIAQNIGKLYRIYDRPADRLKEVLWLGHRRLHRDFWALRDVNLQVAGGETLGVVGPNGSGKSTLLQVLSGILQPTMGRVIRKGRVAALLELGAGFSPESSGRENVHINGEIMGLSRTEIEQALPSIEHFAGIGEFFEYPVKTYSTGMYVRLAFATAIHVRPDILIVDEALAVGDAVFANRCVRKLEELKRSGVTLVFVSHDLGLVKQICDRAVFLLDGRVAEEGDPSTVINRYVGTVLERQKAFQDATREAEEAADRRLDFSHRHGDRIAEMLAVELLYEDGSPARALTSGDAVRVRVVSRFHQDQPHPMVGILIRTRTGLDVFGTNTNQEDAEIAACRAGDVVEVEFSFECWLTPQEYTLTAAVQDQDGHSHDWLDDVITFRVIDRRKLAGVVDLHPRVDCRVHPQEERPAEKLSEP